MWTTPKANIKNAKSRCYDLLLGCSIRITLIDAATYASATTTTTAKRWIRRLSDLHDHKERKSFRNDATSSTTTTNATETANNEGEEEESTIGSSLLENIACLLLVGEYDFCTTNCIEGWKNLFKNPSPEIITLTNCSHYGMLEDENQYGKAITIFLHQQEEKK